MGENKNYMAGYTGSQKQGHLIF